METSSEGNVYTMNTFTLYNMLCIRKRVYVGECDTTATLGAVWLPQGWQDISDEPVCEQEVQ